MTWLEDPPPWLAQALAAIDIMNINIHCLCWQRARTPSSTFGNGVNRK